MAELNRAEPNRTEPLHPIASTVKKPADPREQLINARVLYNAGLLDDAERICRKILATEPDDVEVTGLLAQTLQRKGDARAALKLWKRTLALKSPPWTRLHNLLGCLRLLVAQGSRGEAIGLLRQPVPTWPLVRVPDADEREMLMSLATVMVDLGEFAQADTLLKSVVASLPTDAGVLHALGEIGILMGDMSAARKLLEAADAAMQPRTNLRLLRDLYRCAAVEGDERVVAELERRAAILRPVHSAPRKPGQKAEVLVLNQIQLEEISSDHQLHFSANYASQITAVLDDEIHFSSVFAEYETNLAALEKLPRPDLVINNVANGEALLMHGTLAAARCFADALAVPVINHPDRAVLTTRDGIVALIAGLPGLVVPGTQRFSKEARNVEALVAAIEAQFGYPLITRSVLFQQGYGMTRIDDRDMLVKILQTEVQKEFFVTEFVDSRGSSEFYRKIRAVIVGDEIIVARVDYDTSWSVHGRKSAPRVAFCEAHPELLAAEDRICRDPDQELGAAVQSTLRAIRERIPLEIFGIDFDVTPDGRVVFYEANATMNLLHAAPEHVAPPAHAQQRVREAMRCYLLQRAGKS